MGPIYNRAAAAAATSVALVYLFDAVLIPPAQRPGGWPVLVDAALNEGLIWFTLCYFGLLGAEWAWRLMPQRRGPENVQTCAEGAAGDGDG